MQKTHATPARSFPLNKPGLNHLALTLTLTLGAPFSKDLKSGGGARVSSSWACLAAAFEVGSLILGRRCLGFLGFGDTWVGERRVGAGKGTAVNTPFG